MDEFDETDLTTAVRRALRAVSGARLAYSVEEFGAVTGLGRTKLYAEIAAGRLRARKAGKRTIILAEDGRAYLAGLPELASGV
jgi:hypothetical protein